jgi:hypothetical protein
VPDRRYSKSSRAAQRRRKSGRSPQTYQPPLKATPDFALYPDHEKPRPHAIAWRKRQVSLPARAAERNGYGISVDYFSRFKVLVSPSFSDMRFSSTALTNTADFPRADFEWVRTKHRDYSPNL